MISGLGSDRLEKFSIHVSRTRLAHAVLSCYSLVDPLGKTMKLVIHSVSEYSLSTFDTISSILGTGCRSRGLLRLPRHLFTRENPEADLHTVENELPTDTSASGGRRLPRKATPDRKMAVSQTRRTPVHRHFRKIGPGPSSNTLLKSCRVV